MNTTKITTLTLALATSACTVLGLDEPEGNDTQIGDDDVGGEGESVEPPDAVEDHGIADYCVARAIASGIDNHPLFDVSEMDIENHERWLSHPTRPYKNWYDQSDKPSPMSVITMCNPYSPHAEDYASGAAPGEMPSCMSAGYHLQIPWVGFSDQVGAGHQRFPYSKDIITHTVGNPPESGRHTWMAQDCCPIEPTLNELDSDEWAAPVVILGEQALSFSNADCAAYTALLGAHDDAGGYPAIYDFDARLIKAAESSKCVSGRTYDPGVALARGVSMIGKPVVWHPLRSIEQWPVNINYDWVAALGLLNWEDFAVFGGTIDAVIQALIGSLYLPPDDFEHARYGAGGGCAYMAAIRQRSDLSWGARITCPIGYYVDLPDFSMEDPDVQKNGIVGNCIIDGIGGGSSADGTTLSYEIPGEARHSYRVDADWFAGVLARTDGKVSDELAAALADEDGDLVVEAGEAIAWWSSPEIDGASIDQAFALTVGYNVDEFVAQTGWSTDEAKRWADTAGPTKVKHLLPEFELGDDFGEQHANHFRAGNTWSLRLERADGYVTFIYIEKQSLPVQ